MYHIFHTKYNRSQPTFRLVCNTEIMSVSTIKTADILYIFDCLLQTNVYYRSIVHTGK